MKKTKNISRLWHSLSSKWYGSVKVAYWWRAFTNDRKPNITLLIPDLGLHPDNHLRCSVFIQTYFSGSSYTSSKRDGGVVVINYLVIMMAYIFLFLLPIQCRALIEYNRTIALAGRDNKGANHIYRCKLKTVWWCDYAML